MPTAKHKLGFKTKWLVTLLYFTLFVVNNARADHGDCQTMQYAYFAYYLAETRYRDNETVCNEYLQQLKQKRKIGEHQRYLDTIEETIKGLEARVEALEKWKQCQQEKDQGGAIMPGTGEAFIGQWASTMKIGDIKGKPTVLKVGAVPRDFTLNPVPPKLCRCYDAKVDPTCEQWGCYMY